MHAYFCNCLLICFSQYIFYNIQSSNRKECLTQSVGGVVCPADAGIIGAFITTLVK